eukprot:c12693_g2_i1.p1 GENE.c12693_g2_i1~~c12693_g2_i1.p1  ORF type:complete len:1048 (-),score=306.87 c12693_g2_i1:242-3316(-)
MRAKRGFGQQLHAADIEAPTWGVSVQQMRLLMDNRDVKELKELGGVQQLVHGLVTDSHKGIDDDDDLHKLRIERFGTNTFPEPPLASIFELMWEAVQDPTLIILMVAAFVSLPVGVIFEDPKTGWIEGTAILVSVLIVVLVSSINDYQKERQFRDLNKTKSDIKIKVIRHGREENISIHDVVVGDIVKLDTGDAIPCDGVLLNESSLKANESSLTGEQKDIRKTLEDDPFLIASTKVVDGVGTMIAVNVGENSSKGRIKKLMEEGADDEESALQVKLTSIAELIGKFGFYVATFTVFVMIVGFIIHDKFLEGQPWQMSDVPKILKFLIVGLTIVVVAVPEGLPLAVTISMAFSVKRMLKDNNLVRYLKACEVMGGATTICSDKTGTLTRNRMTVVRAWVGRTFVERSEKTKLADRIKQLDKSLVQALADNIIYNCTARISYDNPMEPGIRQDTGSKTECGLLELARELGFDKHEIVPDDFKYVHLHTFSSARKRMSCVIKKNNKYRILTKGASEVVLGLCSHVLTENGSVVPLSAADRDNITKTVIDAFAKQALRTICIAYRDDDSSSPDVFADEAYVERDLTCIAIVGIEDPVRPEVPHAVEMCHRAGIVVRMVTGDNMQTAVAIAQQCGIVTESERIDLVMEGPVFRAKVLKDPADPSTIDIEKFRIIAPRLKVLARSSPSDKYVLVTGLKRLGQIVAVTGDGTNDGPALRQANVGFAMGIAGTEVAKDASDIIIMDDNFKSIVSAVKWGRNVFDSISKFIQFQLTVNIVAIITAVVGAFTIQESPLTAVQMLWVNLIMDTLASLALATEAPTDALLDRAPYSPDRPIVSPAMWRNIIGQAIYQLIVLMTIIFAGHELFDLDQNGAHAHKPTVHFTMVFHTFVMLQLFNEINSRKIHGEINVFEGFFRNGFFVVIVFGTVAVQALIIQFGGLPLSTVPLNLYQWLICAAFGAGSLLVGVVLHVIPDSSFSPFTRAVVGHKPSHDASSISYRGVRRRTRSIAEFDRLNKRSQDGGDALPNAGL